MKLVYIEWTDAIANANWFTKDEAEQWAKESQWLIKQVGWILEETDEYLAIVAAVKAEDVNTVEQYHLMQKIPKPWIRKRRNLSRFIK